MNRTISLHEHTATELRALLQAGATTRTEVVASLLARILEREPSLGAWQFFDADIAVAQADRPQPDTAMLGGIPVGVKDLFDTADMPTTYGSRIYAGHRPTRDARCVEFLRAAGAIVMGKTVTTEFASVFEPGKTVNPYDSGRSPGGSSSGSAAAVADRMVPIAIGTQTAGSIIRPAAYCGVFGYKPSFGAVCTIGVKTVSPSLDTVGTFARSADDVILAASALRSGDGSLRGLGSLSQPGASAQLDRNSVPSVAYCRTQRWAEAQPAVREAMDATAKMLAMHKAIVEEIDLGSAFEELVDASKTVFVFEVAQALRHEYLNFRHQLSAALIETIEVGLQVSPAAYASAKRATEQMRPTVASVLDKFDVILTPATVDEAPLFESTGDPVFCRSWTLLGNPAVAIPGMTGPNGLPIGVQLVGRIHGDAPLLEITRWIGARMPKLPAPGANRRGGAAG